MDSFRVLPFSEVFDENNFDRAVEAINASVNWEDLNVEILEKIKKQEAITYVALNALEEIRGYVSGYVTSRPEIQNGTSSLHVTFLAVKRDSEKTRGCGTKLMLKIFEIAKNKLMPVTLISAPYPLEFYEKLGVPMDKKEIEPYSTGTKRYFLTFDCLNFQVESAVPVTSQPELASSSVALAEQ